MYFRVKNGAKEVLGDAQVTIALNQMLSRFKWASRTR